MPRRRHGAVARLASTPRSISTVKFSSRSRSSTKSLRHSLTCPLSRQAVIGALPDKVLLNVFFYFLEVSPRDWPKLVHTCRKWRRIVFSYQRLLQLRLLCTHGTPAKKTLDFWPATLPVVVEYGGSPGLDPPAPEDENDIMAVFKRSERVNSISLTITSSLLEKLSAIKTPFSELEHLVLLSRDTSGSSPRLTVPSAFGWSTRLRTLHLTRVTFFALPQLLYSSRSLVDLQLYKVFNPWLFSPEALTDALSGMDQLRSLSLHFIPITDYIGVSQPFGKRVILPSLTHLNFGGITKYLEDFMTGIDPPRLRDIGITFVDGFISDDSQVIRYIDRIRMHHSYRQAQMLSSENAISISFIQPEPYTRIKFQLLCGPLSLQLSSMARIFTQFSALFRDVEDLRIKVTRQSRQKDSSSRSAGRWLEPLNFFGGVKRLHVVGNLSTDIIHALELPDNVLPSLHGLYIPQPGPHHVPLREAVVSFMTSRRLSGRPIAVEYERYEPLSQISELSDAGAKYAQCRCHCSLTYFH